MRREYTPTSYRPRLHAAVPPTIVKSALAAAVIAVLIWLFIEQMNANLATITVGVLTVVFSGLSLGNLQSREYTFHDDHVEVNEGFLTVTQDTVPYNRITDVSFTKSVWQRLFDVGTIRLNTAGSNQQEITISYVDEPEAIYDEISAMIGEQSG